MRRELIAGAVALAGGVAVAFGVQYLSVRYDLVPQAQASLSASPSTPPAATSPPVAPPGETPPSEVAPPAHDVPSPPAGAQPMRVRWVYDGDTVQLQAEAPGEYVTIEAKIDVRLIGVDTPEMHPAPECYAQQATDFLRALLPQDSLVLVAPDRDSWDDYKRRLFYLWRADDGRFVNYEIVAAGNGEAIRVWPNVARIDLFRQAQATAEAGSVGLWGRC